MASTSHQAAKRLRPSLRGTAPGMRLERELWDAGCEVVVGVDEVGRGAWAGPLTVAAVAVPRDRRITRVRDSKMLTPTERESLYEPITSWALAWSVGHVTAAECDRLGMSEAQRLGARRALDGLGVSVDMVLVDGTWDFVGGGRSRTVVKGDATCLSIAAASVVAKVTRDRLMRDESVHFPGYNFERNKGYPCAIQRAALSGMGPCAIHRRSWSFMDGLPWTGQPRLAPGGQGSLFA
jgi:ribonuclease HII